MSDKGYSFLIIAAKFVITNVLATVIVVALTRNGLFHTEESHILFYMIVNSTTLLMIKIGSISDRLKEIEKHQENPENNA